MFTLYLDIYIYPRGHRFILYRIFVIPQDNKGAIPNRGSVKFCRLLWTLVQLRRSFKRWRAQRLQGQRCLEGSGKEFISRNIRSPKCTSWRLRCRMVVSCPLTSVVFGCEYWCRCWSWTRILFLLLSAKAASSTAASLLMRLLNTIKSCSINNSCNNVWMYVWDVCCWDARVATDPTLEF